MKMIDDVIIIGIDSGYGNIKTANCCFPASVSAYDKEPVFKENLLVYESKFYLIGEGHKEFLADKTRDLDYYVLALAAIARELNIRKMTCGKIRIAAGLPLTWVSGQRDEFRDYLLQNKAVDFSFRNVSYHVEIAGVDVFPQGFAAVADRLSDFRGVNMICDIGNGTMNIMFINDKKPVSGNMFIGVIPKFAGCVNGVQWFRDRGQWADNAMEPSPGMIIFFDWDNKGSSGPQDGQADHVGIVQKVENGIVYTIEGNSGDSCRENHYAVGYYEILGYGIPAY